MKNITINFKIIIMCIFVIMISFICVLLFFKIELKNKPKMISVIDIKKEIDNGNIDKHIGAMVIFEFSKIETQELYPEFYYVCINDKQKYNLFLLKNIKIKNDNKKKKITGFVYKVENEIIFIKPDKIDTLEK